MARERELLFRVTAKDCRWDYYKGSGAGGQKKNKTENCCRCTHNDSGAVGKSEEGRSKEANRSKAFVRMAESPEFKTWHRIKVAEITGAAATAEYQTKIEMIKNTRVEVKENGKWVESKELAITAIDVMRVAI